MSAEPSKSAYLRQLLSNAWHSSWTAVRDHALVPVGALLLAFVLGLLGLGDVTSSSVLNGLLGSCALAILWIGFNILATPYRLHRVIAEQRDDAERRVVSVEDRLIEQESRRASLSFGRAEIAPASQPIYLKDEEGRHYVAGYGRVVRVPVVNAPGAGDARQVHARLLFMPDDVHRTFAPTHEAQAEWFSEGGPQVEIDLPGNGRPRLIDVALVFERSYPFAYEWTAHSRAANLQGYAVSSNAFDIRVEVRAGGSDAPHLSDVLRIDGVDGHLLHAEWRSAGRDEASNYVQMDLRPR